MVRLLNDVARAALEALMQSGTYEYTSEFARQFIAQGRQEGYKKGYQEGYKKGYQEGFQQGLQQGESRALLKLLEARGISVDEESRQRIVACKNLERWLVKVLSVRSLHELFEPEPPSSR